MSYEVGLPTGMAFHASAVAIDGFALLVFGRSGSGKSRLASDLVASSSVRCPIAFVGDDRILLLRREGVLLARPHPRIAGFIERRGLGLVAVSWREQVPVRGMVRLVGSAAAGPPDLQAMPSLSLAAVDAIDRPAAVLAWWHATVRQERDTATEGVGAYRDVEDWNW